MSIFFFNWKDDVTSCIIRGYISENNNSWWTSINTLIIQLCDSFTRVYFIFFKEFHIASARYCDANFVYSPSNKTKFNNWRMTYNCCVQNALLRERSREIFTSGVFYSDIFRKLEESRQCLCGKLTEDIDRLTRDAFTAFVTREYCSMSSNSSLSPSLSFSFSLHSILFKFRRDKDN